VLFWLQVRRGIHTSGVIWFYFLISVICGAPTLHGHIHWHRPEVYEWILFCTSYSVTIVLFFIYCFADSLPRNEKKSDETSANCPKDSASFLSRLTFQWFTAMAIQGWRKPLTVPDLWNVRDGDNCATIYTLFNKYWLSLERKQEKKLFNRQTSTQSNGKTSDKNGLNYNGGTKPKPSRQTSKSDKEFAKPKVGIMQTIYRTFWFYFLTGAFFKLLSDVLTFINPQIMK
jgi:hypothetical protein